MAHMAGTTLNACCKQPCGHGNLSLPTQAICQLQATRVQHTHVTAKLTHTHSRAQQRQRPSRAGRAGLRTALVGRALVVRALPAAPTASVSGLAAHGPAAAAAQPADLHTGMRLLPGAPTGECVSTAFVLQALSAGRTYSPVGSSGGSLTSKGMENLPSPARSPPSYSPAAPHHWPMQACSIQTRSMHPMQPHAQHPCQPMHHQPPHATSKPGVSGRFGECLLPAYLARPQQRCST